MSVKQVIVMRKDLQMRKGKMCAQAAHASMAFITRRLTYVDNGEYGVFLSEVERQWLDESFVKICVSVDSEQELLDLYELVSTQSDIVAHLVQDNGWTEFNNVPTYTCFALGPDEADKIDPFTSHLKLL
jgi:PTH2 family peptidyl-tRNA hydrolase